MKNIVRFFSKKNDWREGISVPVRPACFDLWLGKLMVGRLEFKQGIWKFSYSDEFKNQSEVCPLVGFPDVQQVYESQELWPFFVLRVPSLSQPAVQAFMRRSHSSIPDEVTLLREFGRRSIANPYELVNCS